MTGIEQFSMRWIGNHHHLIPNMGNSATVIVPTLFHKPYVLAISLKIHNGFSKNLPWSVPVAVLVITMPAPPLNLVLDGWDAQ
jgi:hypothetical protein